MLKLRDFILLPQVDSLIRRLVEDVPGLIILAGIDARSMRAPQADAFRASGLSAIFNILMQEIMLANSQADCLVIAEDKALAKVPRQISRRVRFVRAEPPFSYFGQIELAMVDRPGLLVIDHLTEEALPAALRAAQSGMRVLTQFDTVLRGPAVVRQLIDLGAAQESLTGLRWVVTNQRMSMLCPNCKQPVHDPNGLLEQLASRYPHLQKLIAEHLSASQGVSGKLNPPGFYRAEGCSECHGTGYRGDVSVFDLYRNDPKAEVGRRQESVLSMEEYAFLLASQGSMDLYDILDLESAHLRRVYRLLTTSERALSEANSTLNRKLLELEASNRVLVQRTEVLMSLQDLGQALITSVALSDLAARICRRASELCGADRVVLYLRRVYEGRQETAEILAERGWGAPIAGKQMEARDVFGVHSAAQASMRAARFTKIPPGFHTRVPGERIDQPPEGIKTGVNVPLFAQEQLVGSMILQSTQKEFFTQGEMALLQTFANQAALAIQRAGLIDELRAKITELEAAQAELVKKERIERELELAREVQQSMLPHSFPRIPGYALAARNEPARQVGGDFYDVIELDANHFGVVVADVSDKGLPAALYMSLTRSLILAEARRTLSPRETLINVNHLLQQLGELNGFVSVFYGVIESSAGKLTYARAGHERPVLIREGQISCLGGDGVVLGVLDGDAFSLSEEEVMLQPEDRLILFTDGLCDVLDTAGHFAGFEELKKLLLAQSCLSASEICSGVFEALSTYRGSADQFDDMTLLVLQVIKNIG